MHRARRLVAPGSTPRGALLDDGGDPMTDDRAERIELLRQRARSLEGDELERFLVKECGDDPTLRAELEKKLAEETVEPAFITTLSEADMESALAALTLDYEGAQLGDFRLGRSIGKGATGIVHEATQLSVSRTVAVKILAPMMVSNAERLERFRREAYSQSRLRHPHVAGAFYFGSADGIPYLAMERVHGTSLREHIAKERKRLESARAGDPAPAFDPFDPRTAAALIARVATALDYCHRQGVIHRDIKPNNILIDESFEPRIIDFGIARDQSLETITRASDISGTPFYMSPEQARARRRHVNHRTDVYSAGAVLYEMLTKQPPFPGTDSLSVLDSICNDRLRKVRSLNPRVPRALELICHKAMEKDPDLRYGTAQEFADDLRSFLSGGEVLARGPSVARRTRAVVSKHPLAAALVLVVAALAVAITHDMTKHAVRPTDSSPEFDGDVSPEVYNSWSSEKQTRFMRFARDVATGQIPNTVPPQPTPPKSK
jgi:serine/threonine protein kinase